MKRLLIIFLLFSFQTFAQLNPDSLWKVWNDPKQPDTARLNAMGMISFDLYLNSFPDSAFYFAQFQYELAKKKRNKKFQAEALGTQGSSLYLRGSFVKAVEYYTRSLKLREEIGDKRGVASSLNNIGSIYVDQGQSAKGIEYYERSLKIREETGDKIGIASSLNNIGAVYSNLKQNKKAREYHERSLKIREELNDLSGIATSLNNIGRLYSYDAEYVKARNYYDRALKIREGLGDRRGMAMSLYNIGDIYSYLGEDRTAIVYNKQSLEIAQELGLVKDIEFAAEALLLNYERLGMHKEALEMQELFTKMRDSTRNEESQNEVLRQEMQYNFDKQKAVDEKEHEKQKAVAAEQEKKQALTTAVVATGLLLVGLFALFVFNRLRLTQKQKKIIEQQKSLVEEKQREILDSITYAKRLQDAILPPESYIERLIPQSFVLYKPKDIVAGDFYWLEEKEGKIFIAAADCTGHGVPGALVSVVCANALNRSLMEFGITEPGRILDKARELVLETFSKSDANVKDGMDISLCCIDRTLGIMQWAGANNPLWFGKNNFIEEIRPDKQPIGQSENPAPFTTHTLKLGDITAIYLFTDGYADQFGGTKGKKFKYKPLMDLLSATSMLPVKEQKQQLEKKLNEWQGTLEQVDDICIIGIRI